MSNQSGDSQGSVVQDPNNLQAERADDGYRHSNFIFSSTYAVPFFKGKRGVAGWLLGGWNLSNVVAIQSGALFTPGISVDPANTGTSPKPPTSKEAPSSPKEPVPDPR